LYALLVSTSTLIDLSFSSYSSQVDNLKAILSTLPTKEYYESLLTKQNVYIKEISKKEREIENMKKYFNETTLGAKCVQLEEDFNILKLSEGKSQQEISSLHELLKATQSNAAISMEERTTLMVYIHMFCAI
jgi:hypothetical protein